MEKVRLLHCIKITGCHQTWSSNSCLSLLWLLLILFCYQGQPDPLNSAFHLTYNMVLNLLRVEEVNPEIMLEKSFCQFQNYASVPGMIDSMYLSLIFFKYQLLRQIKIWSRKS